MRLAVDLVLGSAFVLALVCVLGSAWLVFSAAAWASDQLR